MANQSIEAQIEARVAQFTTDLSELIRAAAVAAVTETLSGGVVPAGQAKKPAKTGAKTGAKARGRKKKGRRVRRTMADLNQLMDDIKAYVKANKGQRLEEISAGMAVSSKDLKRPMSMLLEQEILRKEGERRGTSYFMARRSRK